MTSQETFSREAEEIYQISEKSLMAHTIRAVKQRFMRKQLGVDIQIEPDKDGVLEGRAVSSLFTRHLISPKIIKAKILIRPDASRALARFCIAHEVYHLLILLDKYNPTYSAWPADSQMDRLEEDACDAFAWHLCFKHNNFYWDDEKLKRCRFGNEKGDFPNLFRTHDLERIENWPYPFRLTPEDPFWR